MVRFTEVYLRQFGKLREYRLSFSDGLNIIYGENEAGKSTIQLFIKAMLYGLPAQKKQAGVLRDRDRALPWGEKYAAGMLALKADGREIEIHRRFGRTAAGDQLQVIDRHSGEHISQLEVHTIGELLLNMSAEVFERTVWIQQDGVAFSGKSGDLTARLMNLCQTGDANVSMEGARAFLSQAALEQKAKDRRNTPGRIDRLLQQREELLQERYQAEAVSKQRQAAQQQLGKLRTELVQVQRARKEGEAQQKRKEAQRKRERLEQLYTFRKQIADITKAPAWALGERMSADGLQQLEALEKKLEGLDCGPDFGYDKKELEAQADQKKKRQWYSRIAALLGAFGVLTGVFALLLRGQAAGGWLCAVLGGVLCAAALWQGRRYARSVKELRESLKTLEDRQRACEKEREEAQAALAAFLDSFGMQSAAEYRAFYLEHQAAAERVQAYQAAYDALLGVDSIEALQAEADALAAPLADPAAEEAPVPDLEALKARQQALEQNLLQLENKLLYEYTEKSNPADLTAALLQVDADLAEAEKVHAAAVLAQQVLEEAYAAIQSDFTPLVNQKVHAILTRLTCGAHGAVRVSEMFRLKLDAGQEPQEAEYFSTGTYSQIYFALRMGIAELIAEPDTVLFLDDFLTAYDDTRAKAAMQYLAELSQTRQILCFTCHKRDVDDARQYPAAVIQI